MGLYFNPSENKLDKNSNTQFTLAETGSVSLERHQLPHFRHPVL